MTTPIKYTNKEIIEILKEVLAAMEVKDVNKFRIRAYQNVISSIESLTKSVQDLWKENKLDEIPGVGTTLKGHFDDLFTKGSVIDFDDVKKDLPDGMFSLIGLRGIGAKKAFKLATAFSLVERGTALEKLKKAAEEGKIGVLEGFAKKSEQLILEAITEMKTHKTERERLLLIRAEEVAARLIEFIKKDDNVIEAEALGSLRRRAPTVGDLDIAVATSDPAKTVQHFLEFSEIKDVLSKGDRGARVSLSTDLQVDMRVIAPKAFGAMVQYFTGSKQHNVLLRTHALEKGLSLNEYGIKKNNKLIEFATEKEFYEYLGMDHIPPELRQGKNEIDLARSKKLPDLVRLEDIKGDIHTHTIASDGLNTLEEMLKHAEKLGYDYYGMSDHAPSTSARGEKEVLNIIKAQRKLIEQLSESFPSIRLLLGYEVNILVNTELNMSDELLSHLDYVIASIHTSFDQPREQITERLLKTIENPHVSIIGHPTGRLINQRPSCDIDWTEVMKAVKKHNKILEINSQPDRLDLTEDLVYEARTLGIKFIINTDAHAIDQLNNMKYGIDVARRGWCTKDSIINTLPTKDFLRVLKSNLVK